MCRGFGDCGPEVIGLVGGCFWGSGVGGGMEVSWMQEADSLRSPGSFLEVRRSRQRFVGGILGRLAF